MALNPNLYGTYTQPPTDELTIGFLNIGTDGNLSGNEYASNQSAVAGSNLAGITFRCFTTSNKPSSVLISNYAANWADSLNFIAGLLSVYFAPAIGSALPLNGYVVQASDVSVTTFIAQLRAALNS